MKNSQRALSEKFCELIVDAAIEHSALSRGEMTIALSLGMLTAMHRLGISDKGTDLLGLADIISGTAIEFMRRQNESN